MRRDSIGASLQAFIDKKTKGEFLTIRKFMKILEEYRIEVVKNAFDLYTLCESCGRDHKKNPTKLKWKTRF